ncbi:MAG: preprotein translocase subunit SecE [Candidatus Izemoplasmataceae bacterium]
MAENKKTPQDKVGKVLNVLKKEYPFEGLLLGFLGALVLVLGVYIFEGDILEIQYTDLWVFDSSLKITIFSVIVMIVGAIALLVSIGPFFLPGLKEMNRVSWPNKPTTYNSLARVFGFIIVLGTMFILYDLVFRPLFDFLYGLGA